MRTLLIAAALALAACASTPTPAAHHAETALPESGLALSGPDGQTLHLADLAGLPRQTISFEIHGAAHVYEGAALADILARIGAPQGQALRGNELSNAVLITARDGYQITLALAETDPGMTARRVILADRIDGAPISAEDGPFRLIVEGDLRPARSARQVARIEVRRLGSPRLPSH